MEKKLYAMVKTKSNFGNLNNQKLLVKEIVGTRVSCSVYSVSFDKVITVDFDIKEIVEFEY